MSKTSYIAVDGSSNSLPDDVQTLVKGFNLPRTESVDLGSLQGGVPENESQSKLKKTSLLDRWDVQSHQYSTKVQVEASLLSRLFSSNTDVSHFGVIQEAKRYYSNVTTDGREVEFGTAVRLSVVVLSTKFDAALTLPNIAAKAQLSDLRARISLSVVGYVGPLGELLPAPDNLNVENLAVYLSAFKAIQAEVFGTDGMNFLSPTLLGYKSKETKKS